MPVNDTSKTSGDKILGDVAYRMNNYSRSETGEQALRINSQRVTAQTTANIDRCWGRRVR